MASTALEVPVRQNMVVAMGAHLEDDHEAVPGPPQAARRHALVKVVQRKAHLWPRALRRAVAAHAAIRAQRDAAQARPHAAPHHRGLLRRALSLDRSVLRGPAGAGTLVWTQHDEKASWSN